MTRSSRQNPAIRDFILDHVSDYPGSVTARAIREFGLSRAAISRYMQRLVAEGLLTAEGKTRARRYKLKPLKDLAFSIAISVGLPEDVVWRFRILPHIGVLKQNVLDICQYGFTEILNNAIDHSGSPTASITYRQNCRDIVISVFDQGIGIFQRIQTDFGLSDARSALLELSKGKLTSNPKLHSGQGIYFTSRMFEKFSIRSGNLFYSRIRKDDQDWLIETEDFLEPIKGTFVSMEIPLNAAWTMREVFERNQGGGAGFQRTHVPIKLGNYPGEQLVSRSQAKRILVRFENFTEVMLDFQGVPEIGHPFADEIFRVYRNTHPGVQIIPIRTSEPVRRMIEYVRASKSDERPDAPEMT